MKKQKLYIIRYPNDPKYKGLDCFYHSPRIQSDSMDEAEIFVGRKAVLSGMKKAAKSVKGHLKPEIMEWK